MVTIHQVRKVLGDEVADALFEHFPGQQLYIPKKSSSFMMETDERNSYIYNLCIESGKSYDEVAEMMNLTKDSIQRIVYKEHYKRIKSK